MAADHSWISGADLYVQSSELNIAKFQDILCVASSRGFSGDANRTVVTIDGGGLVSATSVTGSI